MQITDDNPPRTVGERYVSATRASDLTVNIIQVDARDTSDILTASGAAMVRRQQEDHRQHEARTGHITMGMLLLRLRSEFDAAVRLRKGVQYAKADMDRRSGEADDAYRIRQDMMRREKERQQRSEALLIASNLPSLPTVMQRAGQWLAEKGRAQTFAPGVIQFWLDPICGTCEGQRWVALNGRLTGQACETCRGSGENKFPDNPTAWFLYDYLQRAAGEFPPAAQRKMR